MTSGNNILSIGTLAVHDDTIIRKEFYPYAPYTTTFNESDEIRIAIQSQDSYLLPCESYIWMQIAATTEGETVANDPEIKFVHNFASFLFSDARYELNGIEIDRVRDVGRSSTMKLAIASRTSNLNGYYSVCKSMENTSPRNNVVKVYDIVIPLNVWFGFCDDYRKIVLNCKHELILNRARSSLNCTRGGADRANSAKVSIALRKIQWKMPHITLSDSVKLGMLNYLSKNRKIGIQHRSMDLVEYPRLPETTSHMWSVKTVSHANRPRYVVVGLQTNRNDQKTPDATHFDTCNISEVRLHMNSQTYPYNMNEVNVGSAQYAELYHAYVSIQSSYYNNTETTNFFNISFANFQDRTLFAFDTSRADESLIDSSVDIRVEIKTRFNIAPNTAAYCLIIYDNEFRYSPFDGLVVRNMDGSVVRSV